MWLYLKCITGDVRWDDGAFHQLKNSDAFDRFNMRSKREQKFMKTKTSLSKMCHFEALECWSEIVLQLFVGKTLLNNYVTVENCVASILKKKTRVSKSQFEWNVPTNVKTSCILIHLLKSKRFSFYFVCSNWLSWIKGNICIYIYR